MIVAGQRAVALVGAPLAKTTALRATKAVVVVEAEGVELPHAAEVVGSAHAAEPVTQGAEVLIPVAVAVIQGVGGVVVLVVGAVVQRRRQAPLATGIAVGRPVEDTTP